MLKEVQTLDSDRIAYVVSSFVDHYIMLDGHMPSMREMIENKQISEAEITICRKMHKIDERDIRRIAEEKTGRKFMKIRDQHKQKNRERYERENMAKAPSAAAMNDLKMVIREFASKNLRWPTNREIDSFSARQVGGWVSANDCYRILGRRRKLWDEQIFPEGLPEGFVSDNRCNTSLASPA